jgi:predicted RNA binding protein YcfA (HicA-like mRNA interferase family)
MKRYKVREILQMLKEDGWYLVVIEGSHRQFKHPVKIGRVTVNGKESLVLNQFLLNSIFKQAGWR